MLFQEEVAKGRAAAEKEFNERVSAARIDGEKMCAEMIGVACQNVTLGSASDEFCEEFFFFINPLDDDEFKRSRRQDDHLYGSFYQRVTQHRHS